MLRKRFWSARNRSILNASVLAKIPANIVFFEVRALFLGKNFISNYFFKLSVPLSAPICVSTVIYTLPIAEILSGKNVRAFLVCGFLMQSFKKKIS